MEKIIYVRFTEGGNSLHRGDLKRVMKGRAISAEWPDSPWSGKRLKVVVQMPDIKSEDQSKPSLPIIRPHNWHP